MEQPLVVELAQRLLWLAISLSLPVVAAVVVAGVLAGMAQAVTHIQDPSIGFAARLLACVITLFLCGPWAGAELVQFGHTLLETISVSAR